jgi:hypothetical protein
LIVGNPPYNAAEEHVRHALTMLAPDGVLAFLLRINFLGSTKRADFFVQHRPNLLRAIAPRPSFTGSGNDQTEYGLFCWAPDYGAHTLGEPLTWKKPRRFFGSK